MIQVLVPTAQNLLICGKKAHTGFEPVIEADALVKDVGRRQRTSGAAST